MYKGWQHIKKFLPTIPQGSEISPSLSPLDIHDVSFDIAQGFLLYVDDLAIIFYIKDVRNYISTVEIAVANFMNWCETDSFQVDRSKINLMEFKTSNDRTTSRLTSRTMDGQLMDDQVFWSIFWFLYVLLTPRKTPRKLSNLINPSNLVKEASWFPNNYLASPKPNPKRINSDSVFFFGTPEVYLVRKKEVNFILSYFTNLSHTGREKFTSFFRTRYTRNFRRVGYCRI